jgi:GTP cyclohydrolase IB
MSAVAHDLPDVQESVEVRDVPLDEVGIGGLSLPVRVRVGADVQPTVAEAEFTVALAADVRGTHMSRFVELLVEAPELEASSVLALARAGRARLAADHARLALRFPLFAERMAPVTGGRAPLRYDASFETLLGPAGESLWLGVVVPVTSLCPCSKEIADYGAHSQRGRVRIRVRAGAGAPSFPDLFDVGDAAASAPIHPLLKRPDERAVTMAAFDTPQFVEDIARDVAVALRADERIDAFAVEVENEESIHDHQAVARVRWSRMP